jgi:hypothetical protein
MSEQDVMEHELPILAMTPAVPERAWKYDLVPLLMTMIWGGTFLVTKATLHLIGPFTYLSLCYTIATY